MRRVELAPQSIKDYRGLIGDDAVTAIEDLAAPLRDARVLHISAVAASDGVAELLPPLVSLKCGLGLNAEWHTFESGAPYSQLTRNLRDGLQGLETELTPECSAQYLATLEKNLEVAARDWDFVIVHDPEPVGLVGLLDGRRTGQWIWRCHMDTSAPSQEATEFLAPYMDYYEVSIFTLPDYTTPELARHRSEYIFPSINPLAPKNQAMARAEAQQILANRFCIDVRRPLMTQVSRFDPWKNPLSVIDTYRLVKERVPGVQLALVGNVNEEDPQSVEYLKRTREHAGDDLDIHVLSTMDRLSREGLTHALEVNAFQSGSDVVVQKSTREGFGLVVSEAMWKGTPVVGSRVGGIAHQIEDGQNGYLVSSDEECADRTVDLLQNPQARRQMGRRARDTVREHFLAPRHLADHLKVLRSF